MRWREAAVAWNASAFGGERFAIVPTRWLWRPNLRPLEFLLADDAASTTRGDGNDDDDQLRVHADGCVRMRVVVAARARRCSTPRRGGEKRALGVVPQPKASCRSAVSHAQLLTRGQFFFSTLSTKFWPFIRRILLAASSAPTKTNKRRKKDRNRNHSTQRPLLTRPEFSESISHTRALVFALAGCTRTANKIEERQPADDR